MNKAFTQIRELAKAKRKLLAFKKVIIKKYFKQNLIETWYNHSSASAVGYEFDFPPNITATLILDIIYASFQK